MMYVIQLNTKVHRDTHFSYALFNQKKSPRTHIHDEDFKLSENIIYAYVFRTLFSIE